MTLKEIVSAAKKDLKDKKTGSSIIKVCDDGYKVTIEKIKS